MSDKQRIIDHYFKCKRDMYYTRLFALWAIGLLSCVPVAIVIQFVH